MIENIRLSFQGIWAHKLRSVLTMLGIIIGIASIISIVSTIKGTNEQIKQNLIGAGNNVVRVQLYRQDYDYVYDMTNEGIPEGIPQVSDTVYQSIWIFPRWRTPPCTPGVNIPTPSILATENFPAARSTVWTTLFSPPAGTR